MTAQDPAQDRKRLIRSGVLALVGAAVGAGLGYAGVRAAPDLSAADLFACTVALGLLFVGGTTLVISANRRALAAASNLDGEAQACEVRAARRQSLVVILAGLLLIWPVATAETGWISGPVSFAALVVVFGLQSVLNWSVWKRGDELTRRVITEAGALSFWIMQGLLFLYAAAERLALVPPATAWQTVVAMMAGYLILSSVVAMRRGFS